MTKDEVLEYAEDFDVNYYPDRLVEVLLNYIKKQPEPMTRNELELENRLMDEALMQLAALPTQGGALARQLIKGIRKQIGDKAVSDEHNQGA